MLGKAKGENEMVSPGASSVRATAMVTRAASPDPATSHSAPRHGSGR